MPTEVKVPSLGESINTGIIAGWHVTDGDYVTAGQALYDLETDKITSEGTAEVSGQIALKSNEGDEVQIGQVIAIIDESAAPPEKDTEAATEVEAAPQPEEPAAPVEKAVTPSLGKESTEKKAEPAAAEGEKELPLSPAVRHLIAETGMDPSTVTGTGKGGRITKGDLLEAREAQAAETVSATARETASPAAPPDSRPTPANRTSRKKMTPLRRRIAERLVAAQQTAAILTTFNEADMSHVMALRKKHQDTFVARHGFKLGFMSFFVKAVVHALKEVPAINAQIEGDEIIQNHYYDIGVAVGTKKGLLVPVVRDCDRLTFAEIEDAIIQYAKKAREGKITVEDLQGGVFTISNGGIFGSMLSTPILNQPQSGILGMHTIKQRPVVADGEIVIRPMMYLALSYDHRLVDGSEAVTCLVKIKDAIEDPSRLLLEI